MAVRTPGDELRDLKRDEVVHKLFDDKIVGDADVCGGEAEFGEHQVDAVHPEGEFVLELGEVGLLEGGSVADDEGALALVNILQRGEAADAPPSPRMQIRGGQLRQTSE